LIFLNGAQWNQVEFNRLKKNPIGILSGVEGDLIFPGNNFFQENDLRKNILIDALDYDPICNDLWVANTIGSSASVSPVCIDQ